MSLEVGDRVRVVASPDGLDAETADIFERCEGRTFQIVDFERGLAQLDVGGTFGQAAYMRSIWIEPRFLAKVDDQG